MMIVNPYGPPVTVNAAAKSEDSRRTLFWLSILSMVSGMLVALVCVLATGIVIYKCSTSPPPLPDEWEDLEFLLNCFSVWPYFALPLWGMGTLFLLRATWLAKKSPAGCNS